MEIQLVSNDSELDVQDDASRERVFARLLASFLMRSHQASSQFRVMNNSKAVKLLKGLQSRKGALRSSRRRKLKL